MCTVVRGDLPVSIRWFKDGRQLSAAAYTNGQQQQQQETTILQQQEQQQQPDLLLSQQQQQLQQQPTELSLRNSNSNGNGNNNIAIKQLDPYSSTLTFASLQPSHRGLYTCEATNEAGRANQSSQLVIHGKFLPLRSTAMICY